MIKNKKIIIASTILGSLVLFANSFSTEAASTKKNGYDVCALSVAEAKSYINSGNVLDFIYSYKDSPSVRIEIWEYKGSVKYTGNDKYLGFSINQNKDVDIELVISKSEYYGSSIGVAGGYQIESSAGFEVFGCGTTVSIEEDYEIGSEWSHNESVEFSQTFEISRDDKAGTYYLYELGYTADYLVVTYNYNQIKEAKKVSKANGVEIRRGLLPVTPLINTAISIKC